VYFTISTIIVVDVFAAIVLIRVSIGVSRP
jgi:hypothetical protein